MKSATANRSGTILIRCLQLGKPYMWWYIALFTFTILNSTVMVAWTESLRQVIQSISVTSLAGVTQGIMLGFAALFMGTFSNFSLSFLGTKLDFKSTLRLQSMILGKLLKMNINDFRAYHTGDLITRITESAVFAQSALNQKIRGLFDNALQLVVLLSYLFALNIKLSSVTVVISILIPTIVNFMSIYLRKIYDARQKLRNDKDAFVQESIQGAEVVRVFSLQSRLAARFHEKYKMLLKYTLKSSVFEAVNERTPNLVSMIGFAIIIGYSGALVHSGQIDIGTVVAFLVAFDRVSRPISGLVSTWMELQLSISHANRVFEIIDARDENEEQARKELEPDQWGNVNQNIEFLNVSFGYNANAAVLRGLSLKIEANKTTAIVGASGSGKSTILNLLLRLYPPASGSILFGGHLMEDIPLTSWREMISYVSQESYLFSGSIYDNIIIGRPSASEQEVIQAAKMANIHQFITKLPQGYHTDVGERGIKMSGGERQRIAIARAILCNADILIFDEPTSALDSENERLLQQAITPLIQGRTTIIVAHRLSTIREADKIVFIENGSVQEEGTHEELMWKKGKYYLMHEASHKEGNAYLEEVRV